MTCRKPAILRTDLLARDAEIVELAKRYEQKTRLEKIQAWMWAGHIKIVEDNNAENITVRMDDLYFSDSRAEFPSINMIAQLGLAINSGMSDRNRPPKHDVPIRSMSLSECRSMYESVWVDEFGQIEAGFKTPKGKMTS